MLRGFSVPLILGLLLAGCGDKDAGLDEDGDGYTDDTDCDDSNALIHPDADELCDGADNNCDGEVDNNAIDGGPWYPDVDGDAYGDDNGAVDACDFPGEGFTLVGGDCNDGRDDIHPDADEICDDLDNNCDGDIDTDAIDTALYYPDDDGDGFGDADGGQALCSQPSGWLTDSTDCDDTSADAYPGGPEVCDDLDNNCDGTVDEDTATNAPTWYEDSDGDGLGTRDSVLISCDQPSGYVLDDTDCDDTVESESCYCSIDSIGSVVIDKDQEEGSTWGAWMADPEETLGAGLLWEMDSFYGDTVVLYETAEDLIAGTSGAELTLETDFEGTGAVVLDGYLYYAAYDSNTVVQYDLDLQQEVATLTLPGAGSHNTYPYQWGGWSDIDLAVDEQGLWAIYATEANNGNFVLSSIDVASFTIAETWEISSPVTKSQSGNAFMVCGVLYVTDSYLSDSAAVGFAFDTDDGSTWSPKQPLPSIYGYVTQIDYNPAEKSLYVWDYGRRMTFPVTTSTD